MEFGGFLDYSKFKILRQVPDDFKPKTEFILQKREFQPTIFPFIVKPNFGERGINVALIRNEIDWKNYPLQENLIIQEFVDLPLEFGIFYARIPGIENGKILSVTGKEFLTFVSDGKTTLRKFIKNHPRAKKRKKYLLQEFENQLDKIYPKGIEILLEPVGNHNRGTKFYDASDLISEELIQKINFIAKEIEGFYYGRLDVKATSTENLKNGHFTIMEINGANSEPTHIYDPDFPLWKAYREVKRHLDIQYKISRKNQKNYSSKDFYKAILKRVF